MSKAKSVLCLDKLIFDNITFERFGLQNDNKIKFELGINIAEKENENIYRVQLDLVGDKRDEYRLEIVLSGYFSFDESVEIDEETKDAIITENTVAIIMPYLRSEISLLTAQPETDCVVMPPLNIANIVKKNK